MKEFLKSVIVLVLANGIGLGLTSLLMGPGFQLNISYFFTAVMIFTVIEAAAYPLLSRISAKWLPQMVGGLSLVAVFVALLVTQFVLPGKVISGINNWLLATLLVWGFGLIAQILLPRYLFKADPPAAKP